MQDGLNPMRGLVLFSLLALSITGCGALESLLEFFGPRETFVTFVNNSDFTVEGRIIIDDDQETTEELLEEFGTQIDFSVAAGDTTTISRDCDDLQALILADADLRIIGGVGPETRSGVLRDGDEFHCGDRITFTFDHSELIVDFDFTLSVD